MTKRTKIILVVCLLGILIIGGFFYFRWLENERHKFKVVFLNIGQGDAALIQFENGKKMLVDCGPNRGILSALGRNMAFYDRTIDYVLTTHPDLDHYGGCVDVVKNYQVNEIITNGRIKSDQYFEQWEKTKLVSGAVLKIMSKPEIWKIGEDSLQFVSPDQSLNILGKDADSNNFSIVFQLTHGREHFLFTGDMEAPLEKALVDKYCEASTCVLNSDILKVGHHGSDGASSELFLSFVRPKTAIISVGKNKFGHPTLRAMRHLERAGAKIMRTDFLGDITMY